MCLWSSSLVIGLIFFFARCLNRLASSLPFPFLPSFVRSLARESAIMAHCSGDSPTIGERKIDNAKEGKRWEGEIAIWRNRSLYPIRIIRSGPHLRIANLIEFPCELIVTPDDDCGQNRSMNRHPRFIISSFHGALSSLGNRIRGYFRRAKRTTIIARVTRPRYDLHTRSLFFFF